MNRFKNKKFLGILALLLIIVAVPITVLIAQQQQETRQRASEGENEVQVYFGGNRDGITQIKSETFVASTEIRLFIKI